jgi:hypothetical protein
MRKLSYVNTRCNYRVPLVFLKNYDRNQIVSSHRLTAQSLEAVREACDLSLLYGSLSQQPRARNPSRNVLETSRLPTLPQYVSYALPKELGRQTSEDLAGSSRPFPNEIQPLLAPPLPTSRSCVSHQEYGQTMPPPWGGHYAHRQVYRHYGEQSPPHRSLWTLLRAVLVTIALCFGFMLLGLLGYYLCLGVALLVRGIIIFLRAVKADIVAVAEYVTSFGRVIAVPFIAVGRGAAAFGRGVGHLVEVIVRGVR